MEKDQNILNQSLEIKANICLKPLNVDAWISMKIDQFRSFEGSIISVMLKCLSMYPGAVFLDLGSNIGIFSAVMAAAKVQVVAVDAMLTNLAYLHHSLSVGKAAENVRLLNNPVSDTVQNLLPILEDLPNKGQLG